MKQKKYKFTIPVYWSVIANMEIEATSLKEAMKLAQEAPLPEDWEFSDGSFEMCDLEVQEEVNADVIEIIEIDNTPKKDLPLLVNTVWKTEAGRKRYEERMKGTNHENANN